VTGGSAAGVTVRPAREEDIDAMVDLLAAVAEEGRWIATEAPVDRDRRRRRWAEDLQRDDVGLFVADAGGELVGQLGLAHRTAQRAPQAFTPHGEHDRPVRRLPTRQPARTRHRGDV